MVQTKKTKINMQKFLFFSVSLLIVQISFSQKGNELIKVTDLLKIKNIGAVTLTNDGSKAAFTVTSVEPDETKIDYKYTTQVYMVNTDGVPVVKQLTSSKENSTQPAWSPNGNQLAFIRTVDGKPQIFLLPMDGGEAMQLTKSKFGAANPKWSPDGKQILFASSFSLVDLLKDSLLNPNQSIPLWSFEKPGFQKNEQLVSSNSKADPDGNIKEIRAYLLKNEADKKARVITKLNFQDETNITADNTFTQFFIINIQNASQPKVVLKGFYRFNSVDFMPNGKLIISGLIDSVNNPERILESQILVADADGSNLKVLLAKPGINYNGAKVSPSGKWMAYQFGNTNFVDIPQFAIMSLQDNSKISIIPFDRNKGNFNWSNDEKLIYFSSQSNGGQPLYRLNVENKKIDQLSDLESGVLSFDVAGNKIAYAKTEVNNPSELYIADASFKNTKQATTFNNWVKTKKLSVPEKKTFVNEKGMTVEYWIMKPTNYTAGKKYPLLLEIHGGPTAMWGPGEASMWHEFQYFCSQGYGVVYSNPRGSGGYGKDFLRGNLNDWGTGPAKDVLTALDNTVQQGWADTSKLLITGGSYAGYLVAWIISHDKRFKAACSQRGVYDLGTFFGEGNAWRLVPNYFGGYPWEPAVNALLIRESPITYVNNITTPYIIFHGDNDRRTGFVQSEMLYRSLKVLGRPVEYVRHPGGTHELTRTGDNRQRIDQMLRTYEFFERYVGGK